MTRGQEVVQRVERVEERDRGRGRHDPFGRGVFEVIEDDVDADHGALPAEAVHKVGRHCEGCTRELCA